MDRGSSSSLGQPELQAHDRLIIDALNTTFSSQEHAKAFIEGRLSANWPINKEKRRCSEP